MTQDIQTHPDPISQLQERRGILNASTVGKTPVEQQDGLKALQNLTPAHLQGPEERRSYKTLKKLGPEPRTQQQTSPSFKCEEQQ